MRHSANPPHVQVYRQEIFPLSLPDRSNMQKEREETVQTLEVKME
jgi:hypothetical protein